MKRATYSNLLELHYDKCFGDFAVAFRRVRRRAIGPYLGSIRRICDLCCGSGTAAVEMAKGGRRVYAVDHSARFCRITAKKAARVKADIRVVRADMRNFQLPEQVELVTCQFDALNHLPKKSDLGKVLKCVTRALVTGGLFFFDVYTPVAHQRFWKRIKDIANGTGWSMILRGLPYDRLSHRGRMLIDWFIRSGAGRRRHEEIIEEVAWTKREIRSALTRNGFRLVGSWDSSQLKFNLESPGRQFYLVRKEA